MLQPGITLTKMQVVTDDLTAKAVGSGGLEVFATPAMIALMEATAMACVAPYLQDGMGTVGTAVDAKHVAATPVGMRVRCECALTAVQGRRLTFALQAFDDAGLIGKATHERVIVDNERFLQKAVSRGEVSKS